MTSLPSPHGDKLKALAANEKLPEADRDRVAEAIERYEHWIAELQQIDEPRPGITRRMVDSLDRYKSFIDVDLIFDSPEDFLYRQKGQLKLDNTIVEEFIPWLVSKVFAHQIERRALLLGPANCFSHLRFDSDIRGASPGAGMAIRSKDQDFSISRRLFIQTSHHPDFTESIKEETRLAYIAAEIKTNLDKTMFQEAAATAYDLKMAVPNARYYLLCEWLDMTPITTSVTAIEKVVILRKAKRLPSNVRRQFSSAEGRQTAREDLVRFLNENPYSADAFDFLLMEISHVLDDAEEEEEVVLNRGWF